MTHSAPLPKWADAVEQGRQIVRAASHRAEPARAVGGGRRRRRHRVGGRLWLGGSREAGARRARHAVQDRHRLHGAHFGRGRPAAGGRPAEARRRDSDVRAGVPGETVARDIAPVDGACGRRRGPTAATRGRCFRSAASGRSTRCSSFARACAAVRAGDSVPLFELWLDPGERGRRSRRGRAVPHVHAEADLRAARHARHDAPTPRRSRSRIGRRSTSRGSRRIPATACT